LDRGLLRLACAAFAFGAGVSWGPSIAAQAASAAFVSGEVVSVAISAPSRKRDSSSSATRWMGFSCFGLVDDAGDLDFFGAGFFAIGSIL